MKIRYSIAVAASLLALSACSPKASDTNSTTNDATSAADTNAGLDQAAGASSDNGAIENGVSDNSASLNAAATPGNSR